MSHPSESTPLTDFEATQVAQHGAAPVAPADAFDRGDGPLPVGHVLQEYVIEGLIGEGGFGIVYLARDTQLGRVVALKEYMPSSLAYRSAGHQVSVRSERQRDTFELGRRSFVNEAQLLASFDQPSLVKVYRFWEQNGTAYMVMPYYEGPTFKQWLIAHGSPTQEWLLALLYPLLDALEVMHHSRCYHRDIAPDNILLLKPQATQMGQADVLRPMLLDFGAARRVISDATQALTVILKPGYAPIEQYAESSSMKQGSWTDVYALCAVLYAAVTGRAPQPSVGRIVGDELVPAAQAGAGRYSADFLAVIDAGLAVRPEQRPQDMATLRALVEAVAPRSTLRAAPFSAQSSHVPRAATTALASTPPAELDATVLMPNPAVAPPSLARPPSSQPAPKVVASSASSAGPRRAWFAGVGAMVLLGGGAAWWWGAHAPSITAEPPAPQQAVVVDSAAMLAASAAEDRASAAMAANAAASVATPVSVASAPELAAAPPVPFTVLTALQDIVRHADPLLGVNVLADKDKLAIGQDRLQFRVKSAEAGHVYVFLSGTDKSHFYLLFPNKIDAANRIEANQEMLLPRKGWSITAGGPVGTNHIVVMVSRHPRDLANVGLRPAGDDIPEFDLARAEQLWSQRRPGLNPFVGAPLCDAGLGCDGTYGATLLEVDEVQKGQKKPTPRK